MFPLLVFFRDCDANIQSRQVRLCKIMNTSIYYVFITTRSYVVTPTPVRPSCSPLDGDERHDHPLLHVSPGSSMSQLLYRFWNRNPARIVPPGRLTDPCSKDLRAPFMNWFRTSNHCEADSSSAFIFQHYNLKTVDRVQMVDMID